MYTKEKFEKVLADLKADTSVSGPEILAKIDFITGFVNSQTERTEHAQSLVVKERRVNTSLKEFNTKLLTELKQKQQLAVELMKIKDELQQQNSQIENQKLHVIRFKKEKLEAELETKRLQEQHSGELAEMRRGALYAVRWQSNTKARKQQQLFCSNVENLKQELNKLRQQTDGVHLHLHVDNTTGYVSPIFFIPSSNTFLYDGKNPIQAPMVPVPETSTSTLEHLLIPIVCLTKQFGKVFQTCPVTQKQFVSAVVGSYLGFESTASLNDVPLKYRPLAYTLSKAKKMTKAVCTKPKADSALPAELLSHHHPAAEEYSSSISVNSKQTVNTQAVVAHVHGLHLQ